MKKLSKLIFITLLSMVGLISVNAEPFNIDGTPYSTLKDAVAAAPTDGTQVTITMTEDVVGGSGVIVQAGKNIIIDFGGHRFETDAPMVGSTGTETQSFQLLKGSTVYMKNGTLVPSNREDSLMFIQNYSNLTLENIAIDASTNPNAGFYAVSSNCGVVRFIGNTSIKVNPSVEDARAFDMCWAPKVGTGTPYDVGTQMTIDTTGKIEGMIELDVWGKYSDENGIKSTLTIENIDFDGTWSIDPRLANQLTIKGGKYNSSVEDYLASGKSEYTTDNKVFEVLPTGNVSLKSHELFVLKGKTLDVEVEVEDAYKKYLTYEVVHEGVATYEDGKLTGVDLGSTTLEVSLGKLGDSAAVTVYEVKPAESEDADEEETNTGASVVATGIVQTALSEDEVEGLDEETIDNVKEAVLAGKTVETEVSYQEVKKEDIPAAVLEDVEAEVKKEDGTVVGYLDIDLLLKADDTELGKVTKLPTPIKVVVEVDDALGNVPANATRKYFVVRIHDGEADLLEATYKDGKLTFETDRFSQYVYGYADTISNIPQTGDNIALYVTLFAMSVLGIVGTIILSKKKLFNVNK